MKVNISFTKEDIEEILKRHLNQHHSIHLGNKMVECFWDTGHAVQFSIEDKSLEKTARWAFGDTEPDDAGLVMTQGDRD